MIWALAVTIILTDNKFDQKEGNLIHLDRRPGHYLGTGESKLPKIWRKGALSSSEFLFVLEKPPGR